MSDKNSSIEQLTAHLPDAVLDPASGDHDAERAGFQLHHPHRPAAIVAATRAEDVRAAVEFAATHRTPFAVQATGHGRAVPTDGLLISTRRMTGVRIDPATRTAWVEAGATWSRVVEAAAPHGLAPLSGSFPGVGAVSYTLSGGVGLLARRYGFAADHVRRLDVVTPDGRLREVTERSEPDLFWALRGAGGHLGVVTGMEIDLVPVTHVYGGSLLVDLQRAPDVLEVWRRWTEDVPEETTSAVTVLTYPDVPQLPEGLRGRPIAHLRVVHLGSAEEGSAVVEPLRACGPILRDTLAEIPYTRAGEIFDEPEQPHPYRGDNVVVRDLEPEALSGLAQAAGPSARVFTVTGIRHLGGALARPPRAANVVGHRDARYLVSILSPVEDGEEKLVRKLHDDVLASFAGVALGRGLNFAYRELGPEEFRSAFSAEDYPRLLAIKERVDPHGLFRPGQGGPRVARVDPARGPVRGRHRLTGWCRSGDEAGQQSRRGE
ncbi:FAD-binding oxidoreductase [Saccharomonospora glauca]|jgi:FAD/FMN-containing dehydrogenase|uniref:FAD/FMN-dependent dehydrogenase n=1 Tax=Saccharomonospora glauca K62 TaxID=928724 RepID=I1D2A1_9PSEU|nr:FAD-binding oxidoreductase [Saccharomonospora glauca]EIE99075.1 FAD/FMN-dependent dehydrogenase [Saccharomonospora glauca K62]